jgi:leucyl-tRNA synthetase
MFLPSLFLATPFAHIFLLTLGVVYTWNILKMLGIEEKEIPKFADPVHWLHYFPPFGKSDLIAMGVHVDWRRSFITTDINPFYTKFIEWQFAVLKKKQRCKFGKRPNVFSVMDGQVCADHDRASGEGTGPQEYTLIKLEVLREKLAADHPLNKIAKGKKVYLAAATLRPETMYGQTNCFVLPTGDYGAFEINDTDVFVISERSAKNLAHQHHEFKNVSGDTHTMVTCAGSKEYGKHVQIGDTLKGTDLLGLPLKGPNATFDVVYTLPLLTIKMGKGTGVVTSVPSDAPADFAALRDLKEKPALREKFGITDEMVMPFDVVPIINIPGFGDKAAEVVCDQLGIKSQNDAVKLEEAKDMVYLKGFTDGIMLVGSQKGVKVCDAKPIVRAELINSGDALPYWEPENLVMSRSGDECVVAHTDQWYMMYGVEDWKNRTMEFVKSDKFNAYSPAAQAAFEATLDWMREWAFSRQFGLGTKVPWDPQFVIESLSDSTIYMAYYTIAHIVQGNDNMEGENVGPYGIKADDLTHEVFDYVFLNPDGKVPAPKGGIKKDVLDKMRDEFEYWYPMDMRVSGKDLIPNHLTMSLYTHSEVWSEQPDKWPRSMYGNGHIMVDAAKMSKSKGNFLMALECCEMYSCDGTRFTLADSGDGMDDANFDRTVANKAILLLNAEEAWAKDVLQSKSLRGGEHTFADKAFLNEINNQCKQSQAAFEIMAFKEALKCGWWELQIYRDSYRDSCLKSGAGMHKDVLRKFLEVQTVINSPFIPHWCENLWEMLGNKGFVTKADWPTFGPVDHQLLRQSKYLGDNMRAFRLTAIKSKTKKGKVPADYDATKATIVIATDFEDWKKEALKFCATIFDDKTKTFPADFMKQMKAFCTTTPELKKMTKKVMQFVMFIKPDCEANGKSELALEMPFNETELLSANKAYIEKCVAEYGVTQLSIAHVADKALTIPEKNKEQAGPGKPYLYIGA